MNNYQKNISIALEKMEVINKLDFGDEDDDHELYDAMNDFIDMLKIRSKGTYVWE